MKVILLSDEVLPEAKADSIFNLIKALTSVISVLTFDVAAVEQYDAHEFGKTQVSDWFK